MSSKMKITLLSLWALTLTLNNLMAQTNLLFTSYLIKDDNSFNNKAGYAEWINNSTFQVEHRLKINAYQIRGFYGADFLFFSHNEDLSNYAHQIGIAGSRDNGNYTIHINAFAKLSHFQQQYFYCNANRYNVNIHFQFSPNLSKFYTCGLSINKDYYKDFEELSNYAYLIHGKYQHFFQSRLSLTLESSLGMKNYVNQSIVNYFGPGMMEWDKFNPEMRDWRGFERYREEPVKAALFSLSANIGKSITSHLGVSLGCGGQWFIGQPITAYSGGIYYYTENDLFDDPYSSQGQYVILQLTRQFAINFQGKLGFKYQTKDYAGTPALDAFSNLTGETRYDRRSEYFLLISKKFETGWRFPETVQLFFNFMYRNNPSNDPYYDFDDTIGLTGFSVGM